MDLLRSVCALLGSGRPYKLRNPGREAEFDYGDVTGRLGLHAFVVIDRNNELLHVVVASDD